MDLNNLKAVIDSYKQLLIPDKENDFYLWLCQENNDSYTILEIISEIKDKNILEYIFQFFQDKPNILKQLLNRRENVLHISVKYSNIYSLIFFYEKIVINDKQNLLNIRNNDGLNCIHTACKVINYKIIQLLIDMGCDIDALDNKGNTPLIYAIKNYNIDIVKKLLINGANKDIICEDGLTAEEYAKLKLHYSKLEEILKKKTFFEKTFKCKRDYSSMKRRSKYCLIIMFFLYSILLKALLINNDYVNFYFNKIELNSTFSKSIYICGILLEMFAVFIIVVFHFLSKHYFHIETFPNQEKSLLVRIY